MAGVNIDKNAQRQAGRAIDFQGVNTDIGGIGSVVFGPDNQPTVTAGGPLTGIAAGLTGTGQQFQRFGEQLAPGTADFGQRQLDTSRTLSDEVAGFNPLDAAETRFNRLQSILERGRNRQRDSAESRLLAQGRLGGEGGARQLEGLEQGFADVDAQLLDRQFQQAEQARRGGIADALATGRAGAETGRGLIQDAGNLVGAGADVTNLQSQNLLQLLNAGAGLGSANTEADIARAGAIGDFNRTLVSRGSDGGGIGGLLAGVGTGFGTAFGGPIGGALAGSITSRFGGKAAEAATP